MDQLTEFMLDIWRATAVILTLDIDHDIAQRLGRWSLCSRCWCDV